MSGTQPTPIDWSKWSPPDENSVRSPCPAINALANHGVLPHSGKNITKQMAVEALTTAFHLDSSIANIFASGAISANPDHSAHTFDLDHVDKHGFIEHDVSLSRDDVALGSNASFSKQRFDEVFEVLRTNSTDGKTSWKGAAEARYARVLESKQRHEQQGKDWNYGLKEAILSYGESALYLNLLGEDGVAPLEWVRTFFEEERLPYNDGWRPPPKFTQAMMNHAYLEMFRASEHNAEEAKIVGLETFQSLRTAIFSLVKIPSPGMCTVM